MEGIIIKVKKKKIQSYAKFDLKYFVRSCLGKNDFTNYLYIKNLLKNKHIY